MVDEINLGPRVIPFYEFDEELDGEPPPTPTRATVREIDADVVDGEIQYFFSAGNYDIDLTTFPGGLNGLIASLQTTGASLPDTNNLRPPPPATPLSLSNRELTYVIYRLSLIKNWQFASNFPPFTIGKAGKESKCHFRARRVDRQGVKDRIVDGLPEKSGCKIAYFISHGAKAYVNGDYIHDINIHVELLYGGNSVRMPLVIDPDIRFPGGSGA